MAKELQLNLGTLRCSMQLTLHTHHASRIWHGRDASEGKPVIIGLNGFLSVMNKMKRAAELDDPYADAWMLQIEEKLDETKESLTVLREQVEVALAQIPDALSMGENLNVQPVKLPLFVNAQLGFMAVYLLADYDALARHLILAHHTALIDRRTLERWLKQGAHALRSLFSLAQQFKPSGIQRDDYVSDTPAAQRAKERFGEVAQDILIGTRRSPYAPPLTSRAVPQAQTERQGEDLTALPADAHSTIDSDVLSLPTEEDR
ncbi:PFL_4669 family integrating conjugative element protein [Pseudomonas koreensis]|uniref:TIGR03761 family integrating conjugative element protein n=1 Tax=Pseudomonas koreensis TaxID=198620 RepID=A0A9X2XF07_9PSED|nr:TIGR03761 family integrating conjugative element protein [Pseudomonas koreensis]MCU7247272.1 TIGR03761 family integrating conjugative element protein [Pseudomonas koreensis]